MSNSTGDYVDLSVVDGDFVFTDAGGLEVVTGARLTQQSLTRQLGDSLGSLLFEPQHGAGLRSRIQTAVSNDDLQGMSTIVFDQIAQNPNIIKVTSVSIMRRDQWLLITALVDTTFGESELPLRFPLPPT